MVKQMLMVKLMVMLTVTQKEIRMAIQTVIRSEKLTHSEKLMG
jgi:hypothetical protein